MKAVFLDTSYFVALLERNDAFHEAAKQFSTINRQPLTTTSAIVLELGGAFCEGRRRPAFPLVLQILEEENVEIIPVDVELQSRGIELFRNRPDKDWSLVDCISFIVMEDYGMSEAASTDIHFHQAKFIPLLRSSLQQ